MYDVFRLEKVKSLGSISAMAAHWSRSRETPNAAAERTDLNRVLHGSGSVYQDALAALEGVQVPKNGVPLVEGVLSASPEFFRGPGQGPGQWDEARLAPWAEAKLAFLRKQFGARLVGAVLHLDESTPHIHFAVVPKIRAKTGKWKVSASSIMGSKKQLSDLQSASAISVAHLGIKRGVEKSVAKHLEPNEHKVELVRRANALDAREAAVAAREAVVARAERVTLVEEGRDAVAKQLAEADGDRLVPGPVLRIQAQTDPTAKTWWEGFKGRIAPVMNEVVAYAKVFAAAVGGARLAGFDHGIAEAKRSIGDLTPEQKARAARARMGVGKAGSEWEI